MIFKKPHSDIYKLDDIDIITRSLGNPDNLEDDGDIGGGSDGEFF